MLILASQTFYDRDISKFAWAGIRRFQNVSYVESLLQQLQHPPASQKRNVLKQATQIRYCLVQAREYFDAAQAVTLATKPVLLYYSLMHLALAELLLKQDGNSSLDVAREKHRHHGLTLSVQSSPPGHAELADAASRLSAKPLEKAGQRLGTFELWHRSAREMPLHGEITERQGSGVTLSHGAVLGPLDVQVGTIDTSGISLLDCLQSLPGLGTVTDALGVAPKLVRARISAEYTVGGNDTTKLVIHPLEQQILQDFYNAWEIEPSAVNKLNVIEFESGIIVTWTITQRDRDIGDLPKIYLPQGMMWNENEILFWPSKHSLNEFGYFYAALFIVGSYARYYPDRWMTDVERATPLALAVEQLLEVASSRVPLLSLSELSRTYWVPRD